MANITKRGNTFRIRIFVGTDMNGKQLVKSTAFTPPVGVTEKKAPSTLIMDSTEIILSLFSEALKSKDYNSEAYADYAVLQAESCNYP